MCGIFGLLIGKESTFERDDTHDVARTLFELSESRGKEASGILGINDQEIKVYKKSIRGAELAKSSNVKSIIREFSNAQCDDGRPRSFMTMGHARMVTNGASEVHGNNQPVIRDGLVCIHNGIIVNDKDLWEKHPELLRQFEVDTEIALALMNKFMQNGQSFSEALVSVYKEIRGANTFAIVSDSSDKLLLATSNGSLFLVVGNEGRELIFASERFILERTLEHKSLSQLFSKKNIVQLKAGNGCAISLRLPTPDFFTLNSYEKADRLTSLQGAAKKVLQDISGSENYSFQPTVVRTDIHRLQKSLAMDFTPIRGLTRCKKCLLPTTFPFIQFDFEGVCNYCHNYQPISRKGEKAFREELEPFKSKDGRPDCLVPLSGGRDSCFGIHYIKNVLKMNPVAYTYDWGMVTDLARRNISRMCGKLGVEHILISADIKKKREYIRMNVEAWLKKPHLGTIPLFMAGDKQFFYYADLLKRQLNLKTVIFSMNALERTDFKVGFCGIDGNKHKDKHYTLSPVDKARIALFYGKQYITNPSYINSSLLDTFGAYLSYYFLPKNYLTTFDYLDWDESVISQTLISEYDWETATDTRSTWRIGDGTAAFYNYIYLRVAGFTENDTFRSNQIREGLISRESALATLEEDNSPRLESIQWYCDTIGVDPEKAIQTINTITRLY